MRLQRLTFLSFPILVRNARVLRNRLAGYKIDYDPPDTNPLTFYRFEGGDDLIRLSFPYALRRGGTDVLSGIDIRHDNIEGAKLIYQMKRRHCPTNHGWPSLMRCCRIALRYRSLPCLQLSNRTRLHLGATRDSAFFRSPAATKRVVQQPYWDIPKQSWISDARCPASSPNIVQVVFINHRRTYR